MWNKFLDPGTGECYYFNPRTGTKSWYKPKLLGKYDVLDVTRLPDKNTEYVVKCVYCEGRPGAITLIVPALPVSPLITSSMLVYTTPLATCLILLPDAITRIFPLLFSYNLL